jgi:hypothetical protein
MTENLALSAIAVAELVIVACALLDAHHRIQAIRDGLDCDRILGIKDAPPRHSLLQGGAHSADIYPALTPWPALRTDLGIKATRPHTSHGADGHPGLTPWPALRLDLLRQNGDGAQFWAVVAASFAASEQRALSAVAHDAEVPA